MWAASVMRALRERDRERPGVRDPAGASADRRLPPRSSSLPFMGRDRPRQRPGWGTAAPYPALTASPSVPPHKGEGGRFFSPCAGGPGKSYEAGMASAKDIENRKPITAALMLATLMNTLDSTIANVALPHIQGSVSAAQDQITWVLTSYIIATGLMTPLSGWLAQKIGRKRMFLYSIVGFTAASMLCGIATSLPEIVLFRLLQGFAGASVVPLSQAVILDLYPPRQMA